MVWTYEGDFEFMQLQQIVAVLKQHQATDITVHIPYFPYERMDRVDPEVHNAMTMKLAFNMLPKDVDYEIYEPHSAKLAETVAPIKPQLLTPILLDMLTRHQGYYGTKYAIILPDKGSLARYHDYLVQHLTKEPETPIILGSKKRNFEDGKITGYTIDQEVILVDGSLETVLLDPKITEHTDVFCIMDDLVSYGGTFIKVAQAVRKDIKKDASISLVVTHAEKSVLKGELLNHINKLYTTDTMGALPENKKIDQYRWQYIVEELELNED